MDPVERSIEVLKMIREVKRGTPGRFWVLNLRQRQRSALSKGYGEGVVCV